MLETSFFLLIIVQPHLIPQKNKWELMPSNISHFLFFYTYMSPNLIPKKLLIGEQQVSF